MFKVSVASKHFDVTDMDDLQIGLQLWLKKYCNRNLFGKNYLHSASTVAKLHAGYYRFYMDLLLGLVTAVLPEWEAQYVSCTFGRGTPLGGPE